jgi:peptidyl-prolyl cis-trans isomerase C
MSQSVRASHILIMYRGSARSTATRSKDEARALIQDIDRQVQEGADFASLAQSHSDCPSAESGGDLGTFGRGQMVGPFEEAAFGLPLQGTSSVVETDFGFHLIRRTG